MSVAIQVRSSSLAWTIGPKAAEHIRQKGLNANSFDLMIGASGGPKWLVLAGLDRAIFSEFISKRTDPLATLASSIGSWRFACMGQANPISALDRFIEAYLEQRYTAEMVSSDVSAVLDKVLAHMLGPTGVQEILAHPIVRNNVITVRSKGVTQSDTKWLLGAGLSVAFIGNLVHPRFLRWVCDRVQFSDPRGEAPVFVDGIPTITVPLSTANLEKSLRASGSVPLALAGVANIEGAPVGIYRDGGITDYHFEAALFKDRELVFYPHFYPYSIPGWFDKSLKKRHQNAAHWENVVMLSPSQAFIDRLPFGKIPDRKDFFKMDDKTRIQYWHKVIAESERLGECFQEAIEKQSFGL